MPNKNERLRKNVPGRFYVDSSCVDCDYCRSNASEMFQRDDDAGFSVVYRQPATPEQITLAEEAAASCPSDSIGTDG